MHNASVNLEALDLIVIGSGTGMAAALAAKEAGLNVLIVEKTEYVGGSTALSGGAFWIPGNKVLTKDGQQDDQERILAYMKSCVGHSTREERWRSYAAHGPAAVEMLKRMTPLKFMWAKDYSDYHPENPGGNSTGRTVEPRPFNIKASGKYAKYLRPTHLKVAIPMPITGMDYRWMNLMMKVPGKGLWKVTKRVVQGVGGLAAGKELCAGGQALAGGLFAGVVAHGIPVWLETELVDLVLTDGKVTGVKLRRKGHEVEIAVRRGVVLSAGGYDHDMAMRHKYQSPALHEWTMGCPGNMGDAIKIGNRHGAAIELMETSWWFPAVKPLAGELPGVLLAERSLPGSFIVNDSGKRFVNESVDYMTFGQEVLRQEREGNPPGQMWMIFDQQYRNSYVYAAFNPPMMPLPKAWYEQGIAVQARTFGELAHKMGVDRDTFVATCRRFNLLAAAGNDEDFGRGDSAYDRYYGDPTNMPNPCLRPLTKGPFYAVKMVLSDLGTCGGLKADGYGRVLREDGSVIEGLYAIGNTAGNVFGHCYPGAGATIGQGIVYGYIAARHAAGRL